MMGGGMPPGMMSGSLSGSGMPPGGMSGKGAVDQ
jgi:hypothetical protein